jgi:hypothetical protein
MAGWDEASRRPEEQAAALMLGYQKSVRRRQLPGLADVGPVIRRMNVNNTVRAEHLNIRSP